MKIKKTKAVAGPEKTQEVSLMEDQLKRLEALISGHGQMLEMIVQRASLSSLFGTLIRRVEEYLQSEHFASILLVDKAGTHLRYGAAPSLPDAYNQTIDGMAIGPDSGPCGVAAYMKLPVIVEDITTDPRWQDYRELALQYGLRSCWSMPLIDKHEQVLGTFAIYHRQPYKPTKKDLQMIQQMAHIATIAIEHEQAEEERNQLSVREQTAFEHAKAERRALYDLLMQAPAIIAVLRGPEHSYELANPLYMQIIGQRRNIVGKPIREALPELAGQGIFELLDQVYRTGQAFIGNEVLVKLDRAEDGRLEDVYFNFVYQPTYNEQRDIDGILIHAVDVTTQVMAHKKLEESHAHSAFLASASKVLSSSLNYQDILKYIAKLSIPLLADFCVFDILTEQNTIQRVTWEHVDENLTEYLQRVKSFTPDTGYVANPVALSLAIGKIAFMPYLDDEWMQHASTSPEHLEFMRTVGYVSLITIPLTIRGRVSGTLTFIYTRASQRHYTETDLYLAEEVGARAAMAIEHSRLYQLSQKEIEERKRLEEQKDIFMSVASHELRTPVTSVKVYAQVLNRRFKKAGDSHASELMVKMDTQLNRLTNLIEDLLDVTKIQNGKLQFHESSFYLHELAEEIIEEMQRTTEKHEIIAELVPIPLLYGDGERIGQVITNFISNAIKYSPYSTRITVRTALEEDAALLFVQDFGIGISENHQGRVFERFFRASGDSQETFSGLGLGLYISAEIIERHQGAIWVESEKGQGSTFSFSLPLKHEGKEAPEDRMSIERHLDG